MTVKAIGFDIGHTLISYKNPLNWKALYTPALRKVMSVCQVEDNESHIESAEKILLKYNTRENYREHEVTSNKVFQEIFDAWGRDYHGMDRAKEAFYGFFQAEAVCFGDTVEVLDKLLAMDIRIGFLTDVAYGMDNAYSLKDIAPIAKYFSAGFTSVDVGFRKPHESGFLMLAQKLGVLPEQILYVGDEKKDVIGANRVGMVSVLVNRSSEEKSWGQTHTIHKLSELLALF